MPATQNRNMLAGALVFGASMMFNGYVVMEFVRAMPGSSGAEAVAVVQSAVLAVAILLLAVGLAVAATRGEAYKSHVAGYTVLLWIVAAAALGMAGIYEWMMSRALDNAHTRSHLGGPFLLTQRYFLFGAGLAGAAALLRGFRSRLAPALTAAVSFNLLICFPLGTIAGAWWFLKVLPEESGTAPQPEPAAARLSVS